MYLYLFICYFVQGRRKQLRQNKFTSVSTVGRGHPSLVSLVLPVYSWGFFLPALCKYNTELPRPNKKKYFFRLQDYVAQRVRHYLTFNQIQWGQFARLVLGVGQARLSTLLANPRPWHQLSNRLKYEHAHFRKSPVPRFSQSIVFLYPVETLDILVNVLRVASG